jgi:hypothetical protein
MTNHLLNLPEAFERVSGHRPHLCTLWRWTTKGCKGVKLQIAFLGGKRMTTERWAQDFIDAVSQVNMASMRRHHRCRLHVSKSVTQKKQRKSWRNG